METRPSFAAPPLRPARFDLSAMETALPETSSPPSAPQAQPGQWPPQPSVPRCAFKPEHAETARLTEMALRSSIMGVVSSLLARIETSVEAAVWRGLQEARLAAAVDSVSDPRPAAPDPPTPRQVRRKRKKPEPAKQDEDPDADLNDLIPLPKVERKAEKPRPGRNRKQKQPVRKVSSAAPVVHHDEGVMSVQELMERERNGGMASEMMMDQSMPTDLFGELGDL